MAKKKSLAQNKTLGHLIAIMFFVLVGYSFYIASSNMNYVWKWNSVPKYFAYEEIQSIESPIDGKLIFEENKYFVEGDEKIELKNLDDSFLFDYEVGEEVYTGDYIASKTHMQAGPIISGLWVTLKISFFALLLTLVIGVILALMKLSSMIFLQDIATVYITIVRGTPLLVQIFLFYFIAFSTRYSSP